VRSWLQREQVLVGLRLDPRQEFAGLDRIALLLAQLLQAARRVEGEIDLADVNVAVEGEAIARLRAQILVGADTDRRHQHHAEPHRTPASRYARHRIALDRSRRHRAPPRRRARECERWRGAALTWVKPAPADPASDFKALRVPAQAPKP